MCGIYAVTTCVGLNKPWHKLHIFTGRGRRTCPARDAEDRARVRMYSRCNESLCSMWQTPGSLVSAAIVAACALRSDEAAMIKRCVTDSNGLEGDGETR